MSFEIALEQITVIGRTQPINNFTEDLRIRLVVGIIEIKFDVFDQKSVEPRKNQQHCLVIRSVGPFLDRHARQVIPERGIFETKIHIF